MTLMPDVVPELNYVTVDYYHLHENMQDPLHA